MATSNIMEFYTLLLTLIGHNCPDGQAIICISPGCVILNAYLIPLLKPKAFPLLSSWEGDLFDCSVANTISSQIILSIPLFPFYYLETPKD